MKEAFELYYQELKYFACKLLHNMQDAEDIIVEVISKFDYSRKHTNIRAALYVSVKNKCYDYLRTRTLHKKHARNIRYMIEETIELAMLEADFLQDIQRKLPTLIQKLPAGQRQIIELLFIEGKSTNEISIMLNMPLDIIRSHKRWGLKRIRELIEVEK